MHSKIQLALNVIKVPLDFIVLILAGLTAYGLRFGETITDIKPVLFDLPFINFVWLTIIVAAIWILLFALAKLYSFEHIPVTDEITRIILACSTGMSAVIIYMFFIRELFDSRFIILTGWILSIIFIIIARGLLRKIRQILFRHGIGTNHVVIVGRNKETKDVLVGLQSQPELGMEIVSHIKDITKDLEKKLLQINKKFDIDMIIQTDSSLSRAQSIRLMDFSEANNITFKYAANTFETRTTNIAVDMIAGIPLIHIKKTKLEGWGKVYKRILDFIFSLFLIIILSPLLLLIAIVIKFDSRGPVIYKNERMSKEGPFNVYKFRSMYAQFSIGKQFENTTDQKKALEVEKELIKKKSERKGPVYKIIHDPRRTHVGRFLERTSLDELPQLFNVLIGNMSLVGPRPHQPREVEKYKGYQKHVLDIKPGITGLAQISGRSDLNFDDEVKLDTYYIENWSMRLDFWIILKTPWIVLTRKTKS